jgi:hypothetical protein
MTLYALEDIGDAIEATKTYLLPIDYSRWLRLALVVFFVASGIGLNGPVNVGSSIVPPEAADIADGPVLSDLPVSLPTDNLLVVAGAIVGTLVLVGLTFALVSAVMEFVFIESLRSDGVRIRRYVGRHWRAGLRVFGFRIGVLLLGLGVVSAIGGAVATALFGGVAAVTETAEIFSLVLLMLPVLLVTFALVSLLNGFTTAFVVPIMLVDEETHTVLGGWRRFWPTLRGQLTQYGAYVVMGFVLTIAVGIIASFAVGVSAVVLAIPFLVVGAIVFVAGGASVSLPVIVVLALLGLVYVLAILTVIALVQVPLQTFMRCYTLLILGDTNDTFDAIPDLRGEIRA